MWAQRLQRSKLFISFLIALTLVFSYEASRPKAVAPLVAYGAYIVGSIVVEEAVEMGIKWGAKELMKKKGDDVAKQIWNGGKNDLDFPMTKPKKNANGDVIITPSAKDRAKIAGRVADAFDDVIDADIARSSRSDSWVTLGAETDADTDPYYFTELGVTIYPMDNTAPSLKAYDMMKRMYDIEIKPYPYEKASSITLISTVGDAPVRLLGTESASVVGEDRYKILGNRVYELKGALYDYPNKKFALHLKDRNAYVENSYEYAVQPATVSAYEQYLMVLREMGKKVYFAQGFSVPETVKNVYRYPTDRDIPDDYPIPNKTQLTNKPIVIKDLLPDDLSITTGDKEIEWTEIDNNYTNEVEIETVINNSNGVYLEKGDIVTTTYNTQIVNNYYTDIENDTKVIDVEEDSKTWTQYPTTGDGDSDLPTGERPDPVEVIDRSMLDVARKSYDYLGDSVDTAIASMRDVTDNVTGLITFLDDTFEFLPSEWRALFGSAFILGVFAHFFRR